MIEGKHTHAKTATIRRAISAIEATGFEIGIIRLGPDGTIEVSRSVANQNEISEFDRLEAAGLLQ